MPRRRLSAPLLGTAMVVCLSALAFGCSSGDKSSNLGIDTTSPPKAHPASATPATALEDPRLAAARLGFDGYWQMDKRLIMQPDPNDSEIARYTHGDWFVNIMQGAVAHRFQVIIKPGRNYDYTIMSATVQGDSVTLDVCVRDGATLQNIDTKTVIDDAVYTRLEIATVIADAGAWKLSSLNDTFKKIPGEVPCESLL
jgi:hypothetical protein